MSAADEAPLRVEPHSIYPLVEGIVKEKIPIFSLQKLKLELRAQDEIAKSASAQLDRKEFERVLSNVLDNSAEASYQGLSVLVGVSVEGSDIKIEIKDQGQGIPKSILNQIGKVQVSSKSDVSKTGSGSGIGLFHAVQTIEKLNGRFSIESKVGIGTKVTIHLPLSK